MIGPPPPPPHPPPPPPHPPPPPPPPPPQQQGGGHGGGQGGGQQQLLPPPSPPKKAWERGNKASEMRKMLQNIRGESEKGRFSYRSSTAGGLIAVICSLTDYYVQIDGLELTDQTKRGLAGQQSHCSLRAIKQWEEADKPVGGGGQIEMGGKRWEQTMREAVQRR
ncbi:hypothetical protein niasHT_026117 [Heterodera trifolii]|uniref:Uncharacterized protein n=1 Tax=Heterodera trifolii TaxID=157864 RepID=A0ABD2KSR0_9BILA